MNKHEWTVSDILLILILFLFVWVCFCTLGLIFGPKFLALTKSDEDGAMSRLDSQRESFGGFSFVSVAALTKATIEAYYRSLDVHHQTVKREFLELTGKSGLGEASVVIIIIIPILLIKTIC